MRAALAFVAWCAATLAAQATEIVARIDLSDQAMDVLIDGMPVYRWPVSTARSGKITPLGSFTPDFLSPNHRSSRYNNAPMPWSIFFHGHYAVHGTDQVDRLGAPASAGCIRLHPDNARQLYDMVKSAGLQNTRIVVQN